MQNSEVDLSDIPQSVILRGLIIEGNIALENFLYDFLILYLTRYELVAEPHILISRHLIKKLSFDEKIELFKKCLLFQIQPQSKKDSGLITSIINLAIKINEFRNVLAHHLLYKSDTVSFSFTDEKISRIEFEDNMYHSPADMITTIQVNEIENLNSQITLLIDIVADLLKLYYDKKNLTDIKTLEDFIKKHDKNNVFYSADKKGIYSISIEYITE
jgi:hypothetical protein